MATRVSCLEKLVGNGLKLVVDGLCIHHAEHACGFERSIADNRHQSVSGLYLIDMVDCKLSRDILWHYLLQKPRSKTPLSFYTNPRAITCLNRVGIFFPYTGPFTVCN